MVAQVTNALDTKVASALSELGDLDQGTLVSLTVQKKGLERGKKGDRKVYNDDLVQVLIWSGFSYEALAGRTLKKLRKVQDNPVLIKELAQEVINLHGCNEITFADVTLAIQETENWLTGVLTNAAEGSSQEGTRDEEVFYPLIVDGIKIPGCKIYQGVGDPSKPRAPKPGTVYVDGVKLGERVITPAPNGHWKTKSKPKTLAKKLLRKRLPIDLYVRYACEPERLHEILVGATAGEVAKANGIHVDPDAIRSLFKIAP